MLISGIGAAIGGMLGYAYYYFIGCTAGCAITGNPYSSVIYGAVLGFLITTLFKKDTAKIKDGKTNS